MSQLTFLNTTQLTALGSTGINALTTTQINGIPSAQINALTTATFAGLTTTTLNALSARATVNLSTTQFAALSTTQVAALNGSAVPNLGTATFSGKSYTMPAVCTLAKTTLADLVNASPLVNAAPTGTAVFSIGANPRGTTTAAQLMLMMSDGVNAWLVATATMPVMTNATTAAIGNVPFYDTAGQLVSETNPICIDPGQSLWVGCAVAFSFGVVFIAKCRDYQV